jgi:hypothetical protein
MKGRTAAAVVAVCVIAPRQLHAVEREHHLGADAGGSMLVIGDKSTPAFSASTHPDVGGGVGAHWTYGLSDAFNLMVEGAWSLVALGEASDPKTPTTRPAWVANADVGLGYVFDVLRWVPYGGVLVGGYALSGGSIHGVKVLPGLELALGLDYRLNRRFAVGLALREHLMYETSKYPSFSQAFARFEYTWGW